MARSVHLARPTDAPPTAHGVPNDADPGAEALTEERRKDLVKVVHKRMEETRVEIRNIRRDAADHLKKEERDGEFGADEAHRQLDVLQKTTDKHIAEVDRRGAAKEQEVLEV